MTANKRETAILRSIEKIVKKAINTPQQNDIIQATIIILILYNTIDLIDITKLLWSLILIFLS